MAFGSIIRTDFKDPLSATPCSHAIRAVGKKRGGDEPGLPNLRDAKHIQSAGLAKQNSYDLMANSHCLQITVGDSLH
jgi:hypothetical protein